MRFACREFVLCILAGATCGATVTALLGTDSCANYTTGRVYITAAHVGTLPGLTCVYADTSLDYAIHLHDSVSTHILVGDIASFCNTQGHVNEIGTYDFTVVVENPSYIVPGVSGSTVTVDGIAVGFVSGWNGDGTLRCVFY